MFFRKPQMISKRMTLVDETDCVQRDL